MIAPIRIRLWPLAALLALLVMVRPLMADEPFEGVVVEVIDGHSIVVEKKAGNTGKPEKVEIRLIGIYAPETYPAPGFPDGQTDGQAAKAYLVKFAKGKDAKVSEVVRDKDGHVMANVHVPKFDDGYKGEPESTDIGHEMVRSGWAWWYPESAPEDRALQAMERIARERHSGLWAKPNPMAPWEWRRAHPPQADKKKN